MNSTQTKFLRDRLAALRRNQRSEYDFMQADIQPKAVRDAEAKIKALKKVVSDWSDSRRVAAKDRVSAANKAAADVETAILFGTEGEAISALNAFEKMKF